MKEEGKHYVDASKVSVAPIAKSIAKDMIIKKHYTHAWTACRYSLGIYSEMTNNWLVWQFMGSLLEQKHLHRYVMV